MSELFKSAMANTQIHRYRDADSFAKPEIVKVVFCGAQKKRRKLHFPKGNKAHHIKNDRMEGEKVWGLSL